MGAGALVAMSVLAMGRLCVGQTSAQATSAQTTSATGAGAGQGIVLDRLVAVVNGDVILESDVDEERGLRRSNHTARRRTPRERG